MQNLTDDWFYKIRQDPGEEEITTNEVFELNWEVPVPVHLQHRISTEEIERMIAEAEEKATHEDGLV